MSFNPVPGPHNHLVKNVEYRLDPLTDSIVCTLNLVDGRTVHGTFSRLSAMQQPLGSLMESARSAANAGLAALVSASPETPLAEGA